MNRRGFFATCAAAVATVALPNVATPTETAAACVGGPGAFLAAKASEIDALYAEMARQLSIHMWGEQ